jgi:hypothetical protein
MQARAEFHKRELKKTGWNDFSKFYYLELSDFLIPALEIFHSLKLAALTSFTKDLATMTITDLEDGSSIQITSPFGSAALKACHEVQNIGAVETYQRRYLWVAALEIVEHDALDSSAGAEKKAAQAEETKGRKPVPASFKYWNELSDGDKIMLLPFREEMTELVAKMNYTEAAAVYDAVKEFTRADGSVLFEDDSKPAIWSCFNSVERDQIKKFSKYMMEKGL